MVLRIKFKKHRNLTDTSDAYSILDIDEEDKRVGELQESIDGVWYLSPLFKNLDIANLKTIVEFMEKL